ncbi:membrane protein insertase YidC [Nocardioides pocheonensis]|uniref:Membrane protein insertase YidC n=2 Tax=Nocardioides pocheonensis TaxID=661485 RepID=A0A3N0GKD4_9ACTN|nr:membrane protein insertase YidC [Nocardioides pocheonensis]RNM12588.1 membrane protein insertase YidC [Nocardioides pocheonensis]
MGFLGDIGSFIMTPLYYLVSVVLVGWHKVFGAVFGAESGISWVLSIIGLTLVIRAALIPLFVKQIKSSRNMQLLQPKVKELQKKYGHDRERLTQETMALYRETGTNPFSSCLPLIVQMPIFLALFRLLSKAAGGHGHGVLTDHDANLFAHAPIFGGTISSSFTKSSGEVSVQIVAICLVIAMTATTFLTQRQLMSKNMPADALSGPYAQQQKMLLYVLPLVFAVGGIAFPIGVLLYWTTSNLWTMGQQFYVIRNNPAPNTEAFRAKERRDAEKARRHGHTPEAGTPATETQDPSSETPKPAPGAAKRQQPKKQSRSQRRTAKPKPKPTTEQGETP